MDLYVCKKCGEELYLDDVKEWSELACPECDEPCEELLERDRCNWGSDIFPAKEEAG